MKASNRAGQLPESLRNSLLHGPFAKILCAAALVGIAPLPGYAQTAPPPNPLPAHLVFPPPDPGLVDGYVPVITMEQIADPLGILQGYRIQIFKDGRAYYHGLKEVKRLGEVRFRITPEQVQRIQSKFAKNSFWQVPSDQFSSIKGAPFEGGGGLRFTLRDGSKTKYVLSMGNGYVSLLQKIIEDEVQSNQWRCPYMDTRGDEKCAVHDKSSDEHIESFTKHFLTQFLDTYK